MAVPRAEAALLCIMLNQHSLHLRILGGLSPQVVFTQNEIANALSSSH